MAAGASLLLWACATCAAYQNVGVETTPEGAEVYLDGERVGETPMRIAVSTLTDHSVFLKKEGYTSELVILSSNDSGEIHFLTPADVRVRLTPLVDPRARDLEVEVEGEDADED